MNLLITLKIPNPCKPFKCDVSSKEKILTQIHYLDLHIWRFALSGFNAELDYVIFIDL